MKCKYCCKEFFRRKNAKYCSRKCAQLAYYYRNLSEKRKYGKEYSSKNYERDGLKKRAYFKKWYKKNKEKQNKNILKYYQKHRKECRERTFVNNFNNRIQILKLLPDKCVMCGEYGIVEIHHMKYDFETKKRKPSKKEKEEYLKYYVKFLKGFCSKKCHNAYEKNNIKNIIKQ